MYSLSTKPIQAYEDEEEHAQQQVTTAVQSFVTGSRPMLLVGGTDGSGTRSVVDLLENLGVLMAVDDEGTMDVHGEEMPGGWPPIVKDVSDVM